MNEIRPLTQRMVLDGMYPGVVEKWADEVAVLEARIEALEKLIIEWGRGLDARDVHPLDRALVTEAHRLAALAAEEGG
jgi:hypothetical protein